MTNEDKFESFWADAETNAIHGTVEYAAYKALEDAYEIARDTDGVEHESEEFWQAAYDAIPFAADFAAKPKVHKWFKARGYIWV